MAQVRARWNSTWAPPRGTPVQTSFRLVLTNSEGTQFALERSVQDSMGKPSWVLVTTLNAENLDARALARVGLTETVFAGMLQKLVGKG